MGADHSMLALQHPSLSHSGLAMNLVLPISIALYHQEAHIANLPPIPPFALGVLPPSLLSPAGVFTSARCLNGLLPFTLPLSGTPRP